MNTMRLLALTFTAVLCSLANAAEKDSVPVKVYVLVGQSNMQGMGEVGPLEKPGTLEFIATNVPDTYGSLRDAKGQWVVRDDVWIHYGRNAGTPQTGGLTIGYGANAGTVGPELGFGTAIGDKQDAQVLIVKAAWGGKSLGHDFLPPSSGPYPTPRGPGDAGFFYAEILRLVADATQNLSTYFPNYKGQGYEIAGLCWHQGFNDQFGGLDVKYEANLVNFIHDIRSKDKGLGVPGLPIVIATSGMIAGDTPIKQGQRAMGDTAKYPDFKGNVAVIDTEQPYAPLGLVFKYTAEESPANQGYHWNRNARTYTNIGLAMAREMSLLPAPRCPSRLQATSGASGVSGVVLAWQNGTEKPKGAKILRDGVELAAVPATPTLFTDTSVLPGTHTYEIRFTMPGSPCEPLTVIHDSGISDLIGYRGVGGVMLKWKNNLSYSVIEVRRNGTVVEAALAGTSTEYSDKAAPTSGGLTYTVVPTTGKCTPTELKINLGPHQSKGALVYEPFDYPAQAPLAGNQGAVGITSLWTGDKNGLQVSPIGLSYGRLPVAGNVVEGFASGSESQINLGTTLADAGLLADGATLWFSVVVKAVNGSNCGSRFTFGNSLNPVSEIGIDMPGLKMNYWVSTDGNGVSNLLSKAGLSLGVPKLLVGKLTWGVNGADDVFEVYHPDADLNQGEHVRSATPFKVDQSTFNRVSLLSRNRAAQFDEVRFGASYEAVIGGAGAK